MPKICECCGHPLPEDDIATLFTGKSKLLYEIVKHSGKRGIMSRQLFDYLYGDDPNGGPSSPSIISTILCIHINPRLKPHGLKIYAGRGRPYKLLPL